MLKSRKNNIVASSSALHRLSGKRKKNYRFTLIELLVVIAIIAIMLRSKDLFFLLFSAIFALLYFDEKTLNTQIQNVTSA